MARPTAVTWLDFRAEDLARARGFIKLLQDESVIDELGFLALLARFSDVFHPATSTPMSAPRYLYFVAGIYRQLEREAVRSSEIAALARRRQDALRDVLAESETKGVIGREAKIEIKQLPSVVYWSALRKLGMFTASMFEATYHSTFDDFRTRRRGYIDDDKAAQSSGFPTCWDELPPPRFLDHTGEVRPSTDFDLTRAEAQDLSKRFNRRFPDSLLTLLLNRGLPNSDYPWDCPKPTDHLRPYLDHARALSLFARGVTLHYYRLVLRAREKAGCHDGADMVAPAFAAWWAEARTVLRGWPVEGLAALPTVAPALRQGRSGDVAFIRAWVDRLAACGNAEALLGDEAASRIVREREVAVKPLKARLKHLKHLKQWKHRDVGKTNYQFEYRHTVGTRFVADTLEGLERGQ